MDRMPWGGVLSMCCILFSNWYKAPNALISAQKVIQHLTPCFKLRHLPVIKCPERPEGWASTPITRVSEEAEEQGAGSRGVTPCLN